MKLIDADALKIEIACVYGSNPQYINWLNHAPTVDAVPVIRCQECKHFKNHTGKFREQRFRKDGICKYHNYEQVNADEFCSRAERENDDRRNKTETD